MTAQPRPADQPTRDRILSDLKTTFIVEAGAGSGKTTALVGRLAALLESGRAEPEQVATVTFTRKAATELRQRIAEHFDSKLTEETPPHLVDRLTKIRQEQDRIFIGTIHSFCARLLRERPFEAGVPADFTELDEPENIALLEEAWNDFDTELHRRQDPDLERLGDVGLSLAQLRPAYLKLADYSDIGDWPTPAAAPPQVAPLRDACRAWHERIADILDQVDRQPGKCALLRHFSRVLRHARIRDLDQLVDLMEHVEYMARDKSPTKKWWPKQVDAKALQEQWQAFIADTLQPALASWQAHRYPLVMGLLRRAVAHAHQVRLRSGKLSFQDLLLGAARVLRESPSARRALQARWPFLLVDEFQDTDPIQAEVLLWLADDGRSQPRVWTQTRPRPGSLFIVGDPQQSIYRFRRADLVTYQRVKEVLQAGGSEVLHLSTSFRARPELVAWCNEVFADVYPKQPTPTMPAFQPLVAAPGATSTPVPPLVRILSAQQGKKLGAVVDDEAEEIAEYIAQDQRAHPARPLNEFLILTRKKARLTGYAQAFARRGIPFEITGGSRLNELPELRYLTQIVEAIAYPERPISLVAVLRGPMFGLSDAQLFAFARIEERFNWRHDLPSGLPPQDVPQWERAWQKLREIAGWFRSGPVLAGLERLLTAGGLVAQAALAGGGEEAGEDLPKLLGPCRARRL